MPVDFLFERVQNAQPRIRTECRSRNGHNVLNFLAGRGWDWPLYKPDQQYRVALVASREVKFMSWRGQTQKLIRQNGILAQKNSVCGNLFVENSCLNRIKTLAEISVARGRWNCCNPCATRDFDARRSWIGSYS